MLNKTQITDVLERALATYLQTVVGLLGAATFGVDALSDLGTVKACLVGGIPAGLSVIKSYLAIKLPIGDESASLAQAGYEREVRVVEIVEVPVAPVKKATAKKTATKKPAVKKADR